MGSSGAGLGRICPKKMDGRLGVNVAKRIVVHRLLEVDGVKDFDVVAVSVKGTADFADKLSLWKRFVKNNMVSVAKITQKKEPILLDSFKVIARLTSGIEVRFSASSTSGYNLNHTVMHTIF